GEVITQAVDDGRCAQCEASRKTVCGARADVEAYGPARDDVVEQLLGGNVEVRRAGIPVFWNLGKVGVRLASALIAPGHEEVTAVGDYVIIVTVVSSGKANFYRAKYPILICDPEVLPKHHSAIVRDRHVNVGQAIVQRIVPAIPPLHPESAV